MLKMIVAVDKNCLIGAKNKLPWHFKKDLDFFYQMTKGGIVAMGSKTYWSLPPKSRPLKGRLNYIISRENNESLNVEGVSKVVSVDKILESDEDIFIIGGEKIYDLFFNKVDEIFVTKIDGVFYGDYHFNNCKRLDNPLEWEKVVLKVEKDVFNNKEYSLSFIKYKRLTSN